jgi:hypothetical protein
MGPIDYSIDVQTPFQSALQGYQAGASIRNDQQQQEQQRAAQEQQRQMQADLAGLYANPNPRAIAQMSLKYPQFSEQFKRSSDMLGDQQKNSLISTATPIYAAVVSGRNDIAIEQTRQLADAMENSGQVEEAKHTRVIADLIEKSPETAQIAVGSWLSSLMGADKFGETFAKLGTEQRANALAPVELAEAKAKADTATTTAEFSKSKAVQDLKMGEAQMQKWAADTEIARQNSRIAAMNASIARETNQIKLQELRDKRDDAMRERDDKLRGKVAEVNNERAAVDNLLNTIDRALATPLSVREGAHGTISARLPTIDQDVQDYESLVETIDAQAFISQLPKMKGFGQLSNAEGIKLPNALQNLANLKQGTKRWDENAREAQRLMLKMRKGLSDRYALPDSIPDTPAASPTAAQADDILRELGVIR